MQKTPLLRDPPSSSSPLKSEVLKPQRAAKINRHLTTLINLGHNHIPPHRHAWTSFHRLSTWVLFSKHHICVLQKVLMGASQRDKHRHTGEKSISTIAVSYTNSHPHLEEAPLEQPGLLRCLLYEKAMVALGQLLESVAAGASWRERCLGAALVLQCWTTASEATSGWRSLDQQQRSGNQGLFSSPGKKGEIPAVSAPAKSPLMLRPTHD